jgi:hypothetical protein
MAGLLRLLSGLRSPPICLIIAGQVARSPRSIPTHKVCPPATLFQSMRTYEVTRQRRNRSFTRIHWYEFKPPDPQPTFRQKNVGPSKRPKIIPPQAQCVANRRATCHLRGEPSTYSSQNTPPLTSVGTVPLLHCSTTTLLLLNIKPSVRSGTPAASPTFRIADSDCAVRGGRIDQGSLDVQGQFSR